MEQFIQLYLEGFEPIEKNEKSYEEILEELKKTKMVCTSSCCGFNKDNYCYSGNGTLSCGTFYKNK